MTRFTLLSLLSLLACSLPGCLDTQDQETPAAPADEAAIDDDSADLTQGSASANSTYFLARHDQRKCASPMCGGYFVRRVNRATTSCPDGTKGAECYVTEINLDKTGLADDQKATLLDAAGQGTALIRANLGKQTLPQGTFGRLNASEGWLARGPGAPTGTFYRATLNGVRCFAAPCPSIDEAKLNSSIKGSLAGLDLGPAGAPEAALNEAQEALPAGILVAGDHTKVTGPGGTLNELHASQFYTRLGK